MHALILIVTNTPIIVLLSALKVLHTDSGQVLFTAQVLLKAESVWLCFLHMYKVFLNCSFMPNKLLPLLSVKICVWKHLHPYLSSHLLKNAQLNGPSDANVSCY